MKKTTFITIIAALLLLVSCNVDSEHGIYYQVATSLPSSGINIIQALAYDKVNDIHYFLADDGICYTTGTKGDTRYVEGSKGKNIRGAYFDGTNYYYSDAEGKVYFLTASTGESEAVPAYVGEKLDVSHNAFVYNSTGYYLASTTTSFTSVAISNPRFSGLSMLTMDGTTKAKIYYQNEDFNTIEGLTANATGYLEGIGDYSYIFNEKSVYKVTGSGNLPDALYSGLEAYPTGGYKAAEYSVGTDKFLLIRTASGFTKINATTGELVEKNVQFLSTINDVVVIDMYELNPLSGDGRVAIVTYANGIRIANMADKTLSDDIL